MKAKVCRFYGWNPSYIERMPAGKFLKYNEAIASIEAEEMLFKMQISDYPRMKDNARKDFHKRLHKIAYPKTEDKTFSSDQFAAMLGREFNQ